MESEESLKARVKDVSERISLARNSAEAATYRTISSAIGSETPVGILCEIREGQGRILEELKVLRSIHLEIEAANKERHREMCTLLLGVAELGVRGETTSQFQSQHQGILQHAKQKQGAFYGSSCLINGTYLLACILMHMDSMLQAHPMFRKIQSSDTTFLTIKEWYNMCGHALNGDKHAKMGLRIPKPTDDDFISASKVVASPVEGRRPTCDPTHISLLLSQCPEMMNTVEWLRSALIKCNGVLSPERTCRFRLLKHPFVNNMGELLVTETSVFKMPNRYMHQDVSSMKSGQKKEYIRLILEESVKPVEAMGRARSK